MARPDTSTHRRRSRDTATAAASRPRPTTGNPGAQVVQQAEQVLQRGQVVGLDDRERRGDLGDPLRDAEAGLDELTLERVDQHSEVDADGAVVDLDGAVTIPRQSGHQLRVRRPVRLHPGGLERVRRHQGSDAVVDEVSDPVRHGARKGTQGRRSGRRQSLVLERADHLVHGRVQIQVAVDDLLHPYDDRGLHVRVAGQRCHGLEVAVGVLDLSARPRREDRQRCQQCGDRDEETGNDRPPPPATVARCDLLRLLEPGDLFPESGHLVGVRVGGRVLGSRGGHGPPCDVRGPDGVTRGG